MFLEEKVEDLQTRVIQLTKNVNELYSLINDLNSISSELTKCVERNTLMINSQLMDRKEVNHDKEKTV